MFDISKTEELLSTFLEKEGYSLFKVDFNRNGKEGTLSIVVDRDLPISLDDIVSISEKLSTYLDSVDPIDMPYTLDVSSLGVEKPIDLEKLPKFVGQYVNLHLSHPYKGENILEGTIEKIENEEVTLSFFVKGRKVLAAFPLNTVDKARLAIKF